MKRTAQGFTLVELMIVVSIIAIIAAIGYPSYQRSVQKSNRVAAQGDLEAAAAAMGAFRAQNFTYQGAKLGAGGVFRNRSPDTGNKQYDLVFQNAGDTNADATQFVIIAKPVGTSAGTGALAINHMGQRCWDPSSDTTCTPGAAGKEWK